MIKSDSDIRIDEAIALHRQGRVAEAQAIYEAILKDNPNHFDALHLLGIAASQLGNSQSAVDLITLAVTIKPDHADAHYNLGKALGELKQLAGAVASYDKAIRLKPDHADAYSNRGNALNELKQFDAALASCDMAISLKPDYAAAYSNRGNALKGLKQFDAALISYDRAISINPDFADAYSNRGVTLQRLKQFNAAVASYDKAICIKPDHAEAYSNRGSALLELRQLDDALASYDHAISVATDYAEAYWNKSLTLLLTGDFALGWELYEWRWDRQLHKKRKPSFIQPLWLGAEPLSGRTILLHSEQGFGDTIQFVRYATLVAKRGARVIAIVPKELMSLLKGVNGINVWLESGCKLPAFDFHCPLLSLPLAFKTTLATIPSNHAYLKSDFEKVTMWSKKLGAKTQPRIGIAWTGNSEHENDHNRSIELSSFIEYLPDGYEYVSLQKEIRNVDKAALVASPRLKHFGDQISDFSDTAALCDLMDLVISVDTSVAHLSGALGKATWVLLPYMPDWRWLLDRDDSPWYSTIKLYRQDETREWRNVFERINADLLLRSQS